MQSCSEANLDMILSSQSMLSRLFVICNQKLFLLAQLKKQGLGVYALHSVYNAIVLKKILYVCQGTLATWPRAIRTCQGEYSKEPIVWASHFMDMTLTS